LEEVIYITAAVGAITLTLSHGAIGSLGKLVPRDKGFPRTPILAKEKAIGEEYLTEEVANLRALAVALRTATILNKTKNLLATAQGRQTLAIGR
jgi:hypothetical protein